MSEKSQRTAANLKTKMANRYDDGLHHKHNKYHLENRKHFKTHPCNSNKANNEEEIQEKNATGLIREFKLRKFRKRLAKGRFH